jgi:hypothetical protein
MGTGAQPGIGTMTDFDAPVHDQGNVGGTVPDKTGARNR